MVGLSVEKGLFSKIKGLFCNRICVKVMWFCCLFDSLVGLWFLNFDRLIWVKVFNIVGVGCVFLFNVKVMFWVVVRCGNRLLF